MTATRIPIPVDAVRVSDFCRRRNIRRLRIFGSVLRPDFDRQSSDVDVLVEFAPEAHPGFRFAGYGEELSRILGHRADVNTPAMLSPHFRDEVLREAVTVYEQA